MKKCAEYFRNFKRYLFFAEFPLKKKKTHIDKSAPKLEATAGEWTPATMTEHRQMEFLFLLSNYAT